jgi:hypothetical protein
VTPDERIELAELLKYRTRSDFEISSDRMRAAERRLGMWENGKFTGRRLTDLMEQARRRDDAVHQGRDNGDRFSHDEFAVLNCGFRSHQEIKDADAARAQISARTTNSPAKNAISPAEAPFTARE